MMSRSRLHLVVVAVLAFALAVVATPALASHDVIPARVEGPERIATAAAVARLAHPDGASTALLARAGDWPDALAGAPLAGQLDAPVLLTRSDQLSSVTAQALDDLGVSDVMLLGGPAAISEDVEREVAQRYTVERLAGPARYGTAAAVARAIAEGGDIGATPGGKRSTFLASGETFADALAAGAPAALGPDQMPILLTRPDGLPDATTAALDDLPIEQVLIVGGTKAVSAEVADQLERRGLNVVRFAGATRTETAARVADFAVDILPATPEVVHLARGDAFPDALTAAPLAAKLGGPLLLTTAPDQLGDPAAQWLASRCPDVSVVRAVGGGAAIATSVLEHAEQVAERCHAPSARLAYLSRTGDPHQLVTTTLPAGEEVGVAGDVETAGGYDWSPDASEIVYVRLLEGQQGATELVIADADGSGERVLTEDVADHAYPEFSPDGQRIVFTRGPRLEPESGLYVINRDGTGLRRVIDEPDAEPLFPVWSPDGQQIAYERFLDAGEPQLAVVDADGTDQQVIAEQAVQPAWSPDGALIAFASSQVSGTRSAELSVIRSDGTGRRQLAAGVAGQPAWSPDGQLVAFASPRSDDVDRTDLAVVARDGTGERVVADVRPHDGSPTWSPDGQTIAFVAAEVEAASDVYAIDADGTDVRPITTTGDAHEPQFAP